MTLRRIEELMCMPMWVWFPGFVSSSWVSSAGFRQNLTNANSLSKGTVHREGYGWKECLSIGLYWKVRRGDVLADLSRLHEYSATGIFPLLQYISVKDPWPKFKWLGGAFIAPLHIDKNNILMEKSSLRHCHWGLVPNFYSLLCQTYVKEKPLLSCVRCC